MAYSCSRFLCIGHFLLEAGWGYPDVFTAFRAEVYTFSQERSALLAVSNHIIDVGAFFVACVGPLRAWAELRVCVCRRCVAAWCAVVGRWRRGRGAVCSVAEIALRGCALIIKKVNLYVDLGQALRAHKMSFLVLEFLVRHVNMFPAFGAEDMHFLSVKS